MTNQFSKKVSDILMQSKEEAQRTDSKDVKPEHLLLGIMKSGTKPIYTLHKWHGRYKHSRAE